jgi:hypothetical protein
MCGFGDKVLPTIAMPDCDVALAPHVYLMMRDGLRNGAYLHQTIHGGRQPLGDRLTRVHLLIQRRIVVPSLLPRVFV